MRRTEGSESPAKDDPTKKTKTIWACDRCYRLKSKCDSGRPSCSSCIKSRANCSYDARQRGPASARRGKRTKAIDQYVLMLEERLREVETIMKSGRPPHDWQPSPQSAEPEAATIASGLSQEPRRQSSVNTWDTRAYYGERPLSNHAAPLQLSTNSPMDITMMTSHTIPQSAAHTMLSTPKTAGPPVAPEEMFSRDVLMDAVDAYFKAVCVRWYNVPSHERTFWSRPLEEHPIFLVYAMAFAGAPYAKHPTAIAFTKSHRLPGYKAGMPYYHKALAMIPQVVNSPSVDNLIAMTILAITGIRMGDPAGTDTASQALHMANQLKLDVDPDVEEIHGSMTWLEKEIRRRLWWCVCVVDSTDSYIRNREKRIADQNQPLIDRTPFIRKHSVRVRAAAPDAVFNSVETPDGLPAMGAFVPGEDLNCVEHYAQLSQIYSRIQAVGGTVTTIVGFATDARRALENVSISVAQLHTSAVSYAEKDTEVEMLEADLRAWMQGLPKWAQSVSHCTNFAADSTSRDPPPWQLFFLHVMYHSCYVALHLPTIFHSPLDRTTAYAKALKHSREVTHLLQQAFAIDPHASFNPLHSCLFAFYPAVTIAIAMREENEWRERMALQREFEMYLSWIKAFGDKWYFGEYLNSVLEAIGQDWASSPLSASREHVGPGAPEAEGWAATSVSPNRQLP
ncbi:uncharacterized protein EV422DRAFT_517380 [Fimicolochytrium jonesii]|uniref:uncharacterized protein n=1 Tax=Fimicolochytrium jonesii TaxID=1396493 RepID=UPI0022FE93C1|nr:uncharacterized protein EV422DRAFT_517380 [Fimicolochytrium jonesii]KAI8825091.1 hypothetical protein EV422DRAFT_517380 [Fimicolochytrium jonesii]